MEALCELLLDTIPSKGQLHIPRYQRPYSWGRKECEQLLEDIQDVSQNDSIAKHFLGSLVFVADKGNSPSFNSYLIIDGQQRTTTCMLLLLAIAKYIKDKPELEDVNSGLLSSDIIEYYVYSDKRVTDQSMKYKVLLHDEDREILTDILNDKPLNKLPKSNLADNYNFFLKQITQGMASEEDDSSEPNIIKIIWAGILKLAVVLITLNDHDQPQLIFETLNSKGLPLQQTDLIRNFVLMDFDAGKQSELYDHVWKPIDKIFGKSLEKSPKNKVDPLAFSTFMADFLLLKKKNLNSRHLPTKNNVYYHFKTYVIESGTSKNFDKTKEFIADIRKYAEYYNEFYLNPEGRNTSLSQKFVEFSQVKINAPNSLFLKLYNEFSEKRLSEADFIKIINTVESYIVRQKISGKSVKISDREFYHKMLHNLDFNNPLLSLEKFLLSQDGKKEFFTDDLFLKEIKKRNFYEDGRQEDCKTYLLRLENYNSKEITQTDLTIEHILPQGENLRPEWQKMLGDDWQNIQKAKCHRLGNLTLTGYNSKYSDRPFHEKKTIKNGFNDTPVRISQALKTIDVWDETAIDARTNELAELMLRIWPRPVLPDELLNKNYSGDKKDTKESELEPVSEPKVTLSKKPLVSDDQTDIKKRNKENPISVDEPEAFFTPEGLDLYKAFKKAMLLLCPEMQQVAFTSVWSFNYNGQRLVTIRHSRGKKLTMILNIDFKDIKDEKGLCSDLSHKKVKRNGTTAVVLSSVLEVPYISDLVSQALDRLKG